MVTTYSEGPTKASRRLSPLTTRALGVGRASRHTTLAADSTGEHGQLGAERVPAGDTGQDPNLPPAVGNTRPEPGRSHSNSPQDPHARAPGYPATAGAAGASPGDHLAGPSYSSHKRKQTDGLGGCSGVGRPPPGAQATHLLLEPAGTDPHGPALTWGPRSSKTTLTPELWVASEPHPAGTRQGHGWRAQWGPGGLTCHTQDVAPGGRAVVLGQGAPRAGAEQEAAVGAGGQAGDRSLVTPVTHGDTHCPDLSQPGLAESPEGSGGPPHTTSASTTGVLGLEPAGHPPVPYQNPSVLQAEGADGPAGKATEKNWLRGVEGDGARCLLGGPQVIQLEGGAP